MSSYVHHIKKPCCNPCNIFMVPIFQGGDADIQNINLGPNGTKFHCTSRLKVGMLFTNIVPSRFQHFCLWIFCKICKSQVFRADFNCELIQDQRYILILEGYANTV